MNITKRVHVVERKLWWGLWGEVEKGFRFDLKYCIRVWNFLRINKNWKFKNSQTYQGWYWITPSHIQNAYRGVSLSMLILQDWLQSAPTLPPLPPLDNAYNLSILLSMSESSSWRTRGLWEFGSHQLYLATCYITSTQLACNCVMFPWFHLSWILNL